MAQRTKLKMLAIKYVVMMIAFALLFVRSPPNPPPCLSSAPLVELLFLLLLLLHSTILAQPSTASTVLSTARVLLALLFTFVVYRSAGFLSTQAQLF
jgi:hypothetical protein